MANVLMVAFSGKFPEWKRTLKKNLKQADFVIIRYDGYSDPKLSKIEELSYFISESGKENHLFVSREKIDKVNWREEMLKHTHKIHRDGFDIDYVLTPDEDEMLPRDLILDEYGQYMFDYVMVSDGSHIPYKYPLNPHAKVFSYETGLTYLPYKGYSLVRDIFGNFLPKMNYHEPIRHYCFYRKEWVEEKERSIEQRYPGCLKKIKKAHGS